MFRYENKSDGFNKIILEIGSGDGQFLIDMATKSKEKDIQYIGIEIDKSAYEKSITFNELKKYNIFFLNKSIEELINNLSDESIDMIISILPHPDYIDKKNIRYWSILYKEIMVKIKTKGKFLLVTEFIDELLEPVKDIDYNNWKNWIIKAFIDIGFSISKIIDGVPDSFTSLYLQKFKRDPERIRLLTLILIKTTKNLDK